MTLTMVVGGMKHPTKKATKSDHLIDGPEGLPSATLILLTLVDADLFTIFVLS